MYEFDTRIRFSEVDSEGKLTLIGLLNYFQDASTFHSEDCGVGTLYLKEHSLAWVLNAWQIDVLKNPGLCDRVKVGTIPYEIKGFLGQRNFYMKDAGTGEVLSVANSLWTLMDLSKGKPCRVPREIDQAYERQERLDMEYADRKVRFEGTGTKEQPIEVRLHHLDTNDHVNNGQYVQMAMDFLPPRFEISRLRVEYKKSALLSDMIIPVVYSEEGRIGVSLQTTEQDIYANVEFIGKQ